MKLATYTARGRMSYGAIVGDGVVDLRSRLSARFPNIVELLRENGIAEARAASTGVRPDFPLGEAQLLPPLLAPEKILCIGVNYANRSAEVSGGSTETPKYPSMFYRVPNSLVGFWSRPYSLRVASVSFERSTASGAALCIRNASS